MTPDSDPKTLLALVTPKTPRPPITEARVFEIAREALAVRRESFQPGGGAKHGPMFRKTKERKT